MERPSSWAAGFGLGLAVAGGLMVNVAKGVWPLEWFFVPLFSGAAVMGAVPFAEWLLRGLWSVISALGEAWAQADALRQSTDAGQLDTPPTTVSLTGELDEAERYIQAGLRLTLELARAHGGLTWELIGHAFSKTSHWVWWTGILAASGLAVKVNGKPTVLPEGRTYAWALRQVRQGYFEVPSIGTDTPLPPLPVPVSAAAVEKVKVEELGKAV